MDGRLIYLDDEMIVIITELINDERFFEQTLRIVRCIAIN